MLLLFSLLLTVCIACAALAEGQLLTLWKAGTALLFETDNVTLTGRAEFSYEGQLFKTFNGSYIQDGSSSYMRTRFDTPLVDGTVRTGGYTVVANDGRAYSMDLNMPYYSQSTASRSESILTNTVIRSSLMRFGGLLIDLMEDRMAGAITQTAHETGTDYTIRLQPGETPEAAGAALTVLMQLLGKQYLYIDPQDFRSNLEIIAADKLVVLFSNWEALFALKYKEAYNEALPEDYYNYYWDEAGNPTQLRERCLVIRDEINTLSDQLYEQYDTGVATIGTDGSIAYYKTMHEAMVAAGQYNVHYEDPDWAFRRYYEKVTGTPLSQQELELILRLGNEELSSAYSAMVKQMSEEYAAIAKENGASSIIVWNDGSYTLSQNPDEIKPLLNLLGMTPTRRILYSLESVDIDAADLTIRLDKEGRITRFAGTLALVTHDLLKKDHALSMTFDFTAGHYGNSTVDTFNPADYNVVSAQEFFASDAAKDGLTVLKRDLNMDELPKVLLFNGVEYPIPSAESNSAGNG